jgi:uncharacterized protein (DUF302 family)
MREHVKEKMMLENVSRYDFPTTVEKLATIVQESGWKAPFTHDLQNTIRNFGKDILPAKVLEICHPKHSGRLLELDNERIVSTFMPCRISVYEKSDGKVYIARLNASLLAGSFGGLTEEVMTQSFAEMENMLNPLVK